MNPSNDDGALVAWYRPLGLAVEDAFVLVWSEGTSPNFVLQGMLIPG